MTLSFFARRAVSVAMLAIPAGAATIPMLHQGSPAAGAPEVNRFPHTEQELLVQFRTGTSTLTKAQVLGKFDATTLETVVAEVARMDKKGDLDLVKLPPGVALEGAMEGLKLDPNVEFAEPNWIYQHMATSNDTYYTNGSMWGMYGDQTSPANQYGCQAGEAWANGNTGSASVYVGIIDEGVMWNHTDLNGQVWRNTLDPQDGIDNDGNGYKDDIRGWDFNSNDNTVYDGPTDDHGTHVSGTIGAKGGNGTGVVGVCWNVRLIPAKFLGPSGGTTSNAIKACDYITNLKINQGLNVVATNNSWGGGGYSQGLYDAIERANVQNILFCAAAGNASSNNDTNPSYPASYSNTNIIAVAAITSTGGLASFSNYGASTVDIGAPGSNVISTVPSSSGGSSYAYYSGTSMATPHVTGACALYAASHPGSTAAQIKNAILSSAVATSSLSGKCVTGGRLNVSGF
jgi:subtilisin family serine protease